MSGSRPIAERDDILSFEPPDFAGDKRIELVGVGIANLVLFCLADPLDDDLLGVLRGDSPKVL